MSDRYPGTPDGRYFVVRGRLWRKSDPALDEATRNRLVKHLMSARRAVRDAKGDPDAIAKARHLVGDAKVALGERGAPWWEDGAPDYIGTWQKTRPMPSGSPTLENRLASKQQRRLRRRLLFRPQLVGPLHRYQLGRKCPFLECECIIKGAVKPLFVLVGM